MASACDRVQPGRRLAERLDEDPSGHGISFGLANMCSRDMNQEFIGVIPVDATLQPAHQLRVDVFAGSSPKAVPIWPMMEDELAPSGKALGNAAADTALPELLVKTKRSQSWFTKSDVALSDDQEQQVTDMVGECRFHVGESCDYHGACTPHKGGLDEEPQNEAIPFRG